MNDEGLEYEMWRPGHYNNNESYRKQINSHLSQFSLINQPGKLEEFFILASQTIKERE